MPRSRKEPPGYPLCCPTCLQIGSSHNSLLRFNNLMEHFTKTQCLQVYYERYKECRWTGRLRGIEDEVQKCPWSWDVSPLGTRMQSPTWKLIRAPCLRAFINLNLQHFVTPSQWSVGGAESLKPSSLGLSDFHPILRVTRGPTPNHLFGINSGVTKGDSFE